MGRRVAGCVYKCVSQTLFLDERINHQQSLPRHRSADVCGGRIDLTCPSQGLQRHSETVTLRLAPDLFHSLSVRPSFCSLPAHSSVNYTLKCFGKPHLVFGAVPAAVKKHYLITMFVDTRPAQEEQ